MGKLNTRKMETRRKELGLSQAEAARKAGLSGKQVWSDIVNDRRSNITLATLYAIAEALQLHASELLN